MHGLNLAALGPSDDESHRCAGDPDSPAFLPYRGPAFYTEDSDRPRWHGEGWALAIDWIYATLTAEDKATIATVFTRWGEEIIERAYHHPEPVGVINDPALLADRTQVRWAGNNYFTAHMRNLGLLALALDPADGGDALEGYLENAIGAWLYLFDELTYTDAQGGLLPEGFEYSPQTASYAMQFLLALKTASRADTGRYGQKVIASANPFWNDFVTGYLHSLSPQTENDPDFGQIYLPAWYGDAQHYWLTDFIDVFGSMGIYAALTGDQAQLNTLRWLELNTPAGGSADLAGRVRGVDNLRGAILYFILFPPDAPAPTDPRPALATGYAAPGMRRLFSRTSWGEEAAWLTYALSWNEIDHQMADGNHFEFYRNGEWLTKARTGYANIAEGIASSEFRNTMALQNVRPADLGDDDFRVDLWRRGSQYNLVASGDPGPLLHSFGDGYTFAGGDATNLGARDVNRCGACQPGAALDSTGSDSCVRSGRLAGRSLQTRLVPVAASCYGQRTARRHDQRRRPAVGHRHAAAGGRHHADGGSGPGKHRRDRSGQRSDDPASLRRGAVCGQRALPTPGAGCGQQRRFGDRRRLPQR
jgi:hypothetical protein